MTGHFANNTFCCFVDPRKDPSTGEMLGGIRFAISQHLNVHTIFSNLGALSLHQWQLIGSLGLHRKNSNISLPRQAFWNRSKSIKILQVSMVFPMVFRVMVPLFIPLPEKHFAPHPKVDP